MFALSLRGIYLTQIRNVPFVRTLVGDAAAYDAWARRVADGDWLGGEAFYQAPAYPYFLAVVYRTVGSGPVAFRVVQAVLGSVACVLLGMAGRAFFDRRIGLTTGMLLAIYPPAIFFGGLLQKTALDVVLLAALLWRLGAARQRPSAWNGALAGVLLALLALTRENALILGPVILAWAFIGLPQSAGVRVRWAAMFIVGLAVPLGLVAWRNHHVGGVWAVTTTQAGPNFWIGNNPTATGRYEPLVPGQETPLYERADARRLAEAATGRALTDGEVSRYWLGEATHFIRTEPGRWLALVGRKLLLTLNTYEISDTEGYVVYRGYSSLLGVMATVLHLGLLVPLAAAGLVLSWPQRREIWLLHVILLVLLASIVAFYVLARYRFPLVPVLAMFAAAGVVEAWRRRRDRRQLVGAAMAMIATAVVCNLPVNPAAQLDASAYGNLATVLAEQGDLVAAGNVLDLALETSPQSAVLHYNRAVAYRLAGDPRAALDQLAEALRLQPALPQAAREMGLAHEALGDRAAAKAWFIRALRENPNDPEARAGAGRTAE